MKSILLKKGREHSLLRRHPWIFSGAVAGVSDDPEPGETVDVFADDERTWVGRGAFSPSSQIAVRIWTFDREEAVDDGFFARRVAAAAAARAGLWNPPERSAVRLVHGESDGLPGVVVDRYADTLVIQLSTAGAEAHRDEILAALRGTVPDCATVYERSDSPARVHEGLPPCNALRFGPPPRPDLVAAWAGLSFSVPVETGHKTGVYLDQADNIPAVAALADGADVLDAFCYTGGFSMAALRGGAAHVTSLDSSADALAALEANVARNGLDASRLEVLRDDAFLRLRRFRDQGRSFDLVVLDPPKFAESRSRVERACRAYKDINLLAFKLLRPHGRLVTFSCSGSVGPDLFQKVVADAALDAGRFARVVRRLSQAADHPTSLAFPEGSYLKGLVCDVLD